MNKLSCCELNEGIDVLMEGRKGKRQGEEGSGALQAHCGKCPITYLLGAVASRTVVTRVTLVALNSNFPHPTPHGKMK